MRQNGNGRMIFNTGDVYEGEWYNLEPHGFGVWKYKNGDTYEGLWKHGQRSTDTKTGKMTYANGQM